MKLNMGFTQLEMKVVELEGRLVDIDSLKKEQGKLVMALSEAQDECDEALFNIQLLKIQLQEAMYRCPRRGGKTVSRAVLGGGAPACLATSVILGRGSSGATIAATAASFCVAAGAWCLLQGDGSRPSYEGVGLLALDCFMLGLVFSVVWL